MCIANYRRTLFRKKKHNFNPNLLHRCNLSKTIPYDIQESPIFNIFGGIIQKTLNCKNKQNSMCNKSLSVVENNFISISVDFRKNKRLEDTLKQHFSNENTKKFCGDCEKEVDVNVEYKLKKIPNILCIHVNRFVSEKLKVKR